MTRPYELGDVPKRLRRRANVIATGAMVAIAVALMVLVLVVDGVRPEPLTWVILAIVAVVVVAGLVLAIRALTPGERATLEAAERRVIEPPDPDEPIADLDLQIDLVDRVVVDPMAPIPDDQAVLAADASEIDLTQGPTVRVVLHPGPITRRRLTGRPDALVIVADAEALDVPGWIVERRSRMIERADRVVIPWASIERFRVRAERDGPDIYDITAHADAPPPGRWRIRRNEIADEIALLDHVRRVGRITIELEDSIRS
jgi:hypothetical protein